MNILIAGGGKVGSELTEKLSAEGHAITLIDSDAEVLEGIMSDFDVIGVQGNAASAETLENAGIAKADVLIAVTDADEVNLLSCMTANVLNPGIHTVGRIRNPEYSSQAYRMPQFFGLNMVINPDREAAAAISRLLKFPGFLNIETFARGNVEIVSLKIGSDSPLKNTHLSQLTSIVKCRVLVCAVMRRGECLMPNGQFVLQEEDVIYVTASTENLSTLLRNLGIITRKVRNTLITGGGRLSFYLAQELSHTDIKVTIIEKDPVRCDELASGLKTATIINGDASSQALLDSEGIDRFDSMISLTGLDELNIVMSLYAHVHKVPQIITKLSHAENNRILDSLNVGSVISPKELSCTSIVRYVRAMQNSVGAAQSIHRIAKGKGEAIEFLIDENVKHRGERFRDLKTKDDVLIVSITRGGNTEIASGSSSYDVNDTVVIVTNGRETIRNMNDIFVE